ncbi:MAG TPA: hypothetical protein ENN76_02690, partial [Euryarchaeota archaeon]|nr:hypothetical protein [Euryarchaeota archaeon]
MNKKSNDAFPVAISAFVMLFLAVVFFFDFSRELVGTVYNFNLSNMTIGISVGALAAFFSPALLLFCPRWASPRLLLTGGAVAMGLSRIGLAGGMPVHLHLLFALCGVAFSGIFLVGFFLECRFKEGSLFSAGLAVAFAVITDMALGSLGGTYNPLIQWFDGGYSASVSIVVLLAVGFAVAAGVHSSRPENTFCQEYSKPVAPDDPWINPLLGVGMGGLLFLYLNFLGSPNVIARWTEGDLVLASLSGAISLGM